MKRPVLFRFLLRQVHKIKNGENIGTFKLKAT
jgi:hypothetical protein